MPIRVLILSIVMLMFVPACAQDTGPVDVDAPSLEVMVGQMFMAGFRGYVVDENSPIVRDIRERHLGGVILFNYDAALKQPERNIESPVQVGALIRRLQSEAHVPLLVAVDQEGGRVQRLRADHGFVETPSAAELGRTNDTVPALNAGRIIGTQLHALGFNLDFAPVVDVNVDPDSPAIGRLDRSFSSDPAQVAAHAGPFVQALRREGVLSCLKHFPGHGSARDDSHQGVTDVTRTWVKEELTPYRTLLAEGKVDMIMAAHVFNERLDPKLPASLSEKTITELLRRELGFDGVVVTDDLQMRAITDQFGFENSVLLAIEAGADILLFGNNLAYDPEAVGRAYGLILESVEQGRVSRERIRRSYDRIMRLKTRFFLP